MKFYSGLGDDGRTHTLRSSALSKNDLIMEAIGSIDEASAFFSLAINHVQVQEMKTIIQQAQVDLHLIMAEVAGDEKSRLNSQRTTWLEEKIDYWGKDLDPSRDFVSDWTGSASALLNVTRTVVRRAERKNVECFEKKKINNPEIIRYLNRLSSLVYVLQLYLENHSTGR